MLFNCNLNEIPVDTTNSPGAGIGLDTSSCPCLLFTLSLRGRALFIVALYVVDTWLDWLLALGVTIEVHVMFNVIEELLETHGGNVVVLVGKLSC